MRGKKSPQEPIEGLDATVGDFWSWAYSNVRENTVRSIFAEWLVGTLLGVENDGRIEWDAYDLELDGVKIEVKSAAYVQSWAQTAPSKIRFDIAEKVSWEAKTNTYADEATRAADVYVFALHDDHDMEHADPLDVASWRFWLMTSAHIAEAFGAQKSVALSRVQAHATEAHAENLQTAFEGLFEIDPD